jgi:hypothetical protein
MERRRVVDRRGDLGFVERLADAVALGRPAHEQVVDVARFVFGNLDELAEPEVGVARRSLPAAARPAVEMAEEEAQEGGLELVESRVVAHELEVGLVA